MPVRSPSLCALLVVAALAAACASEADPQTAPAPSVTVSVEPDPSTTEAPTTTTTTTLALPEPAPVAWAACGGGFDCATLTVPIDYLDPEGPTLDLALTRRPAGDPQQRIGS
ncbi:MAG: hypothetical protein ACSLFP_14025, partial [Acidimicrobiales bacterium]